MALTPGYTIGASLRLSSEYAQNVLPSQYDPCS